MTTNIPQTKEDLMATAVLDPRYIVESGFEVINKKRESVPFVFNYNQNKFYEERTKRDDIVKGGQFGISTEILALFTVKFLLVPNSWAVCISHEAEATRRLFQKVDYWLNRLPEWLQWAYQPTTDAKASLANSVMNSRFYIGTAGARAFGRGDTIHYAHLSESSRWPDFTIMTGIIRAVPIDDDIDTWIIKETTANGEGTPHHREYVRAVNGKSEFKNHFLNWLDQPEYQVNDAPHVPEDTFDEDEKMIKALFPEKFTNSRVVWRRRMLGQLPEEPGITPNQLFKQEFPVTWEEAFLSSGNPVFDLEALSDYQNRVTVPIMRGNLAGLNPNINMQTDSTGPLQVWKKPERGRQYVLFADVGQFSDYCVGTVVDRQTFDVVAKFRKVMKAHAFADELRRVGLWYNEALTAVEVNNMGQSTMDRLVDLQYPNLYTRLRRDKKKKIDVREYGWLTNKVTKPRMVGHAQTLLRNQDSAIPDEEILSELRTFVKKESGAMEAQDGCHDDQVISLCGAWYVCHEHPYLPEATGENNRMQRKVNKYRRLRSSRR